MNAIFSLPFSAMALAVLSCVGCTSLAPIPEFTETHCGKLVLMLPDRIDACPLGTGGCAWEAGVNAWAITYPSNSASVKEHEIEHVCGMIHRQPWVSPGLFKTCAEVTEGGSTPWLPGQIMCRSINEGIRIEEDPSVIERVRKLHAQAIGTPGKMTSDY